MSNIPSKAERELLSASALTEAQLERAREIASDALGRHAEADDPLVRSLLIALAINQQTTVTRGASGPTVLTRSPG